jgi:signal transduction histidine kinase
VDPGARRPGGRHDQQATADALGLLRTLPADGPPGVEVIRPAAGPVVRVAAWAGLVRSALSPLVDNAMRHAITRVELAAEARNDRVLLSVVDDGAGLSSEEAERVFVPGHRGAGGGTAGLGLAVVRRLVESVGGTVRAVPGPEGRFEVELPPG